MPKRGENNLRRYIRISQAVPRQVGVTALKPLDEKGSLTKPALNKRQRVTNTGHKISSLKSSQASSCGSFFSKTRHDYEGFAFANLQQTNRSKAHEPRASRLVASCRTSTSIASDGICTYLTTEPRMKQLRTDFRWGWIASSTTWVCFSLIFRYWSTETRTPETARSFFSSTVICALMMWKKPDLSGWRRNGADFEVQWKSTERFRATC